MVLGYAIDSNLIRQTVINSGLSAEFEFLNSSCVSLFVVLIEVKALT